MSIFIHEKAIVDTKQIGEGTHVWAFSHIMANAKIGKDGNIGEGCFIENEVEIGNSVTIKNGVSVWDGVVIEDDVFVGPSVTFTNDLFPRSKQHDYEKKKTMLKKGSSIGANATLIAGITVGMYAMVGAGSVVTKSVEDFSLVYGNPASFQGYICVCGQKLTFVENIAHCNCGRKYSKNDSGVKLHE